MLQEEIHKLVDDLAWEDVEAVAKEDSNIERHLRSCKVCQERANKVEEGRLASMGASKRQLILKTGRRLAEMFMNRHQA